MNEDLEVLYAILREWKKTPLYRDITQMEFYTGLKNDKCTDCKVLMVQC